MPPTLGIKLLMQQTAAVGRAMERSTSEEKELLQGVWNFCHDVLDRADMIRRPDGSYGLLTIEIFPVDGPPMPMDEQRDRALALNSATKKWPRHS
jgi:hypothetical protein